MTEVQAYNANSTTAIAKCGPIADWGVSAITNMSYLCEGFQNFNADISSWDTSSVTTMEGMFQVVSACPDPKAFRQAPPAARLATASDPPASRPRTSPRILRAPISTRQSARAFNQPLSFETSSVTIMYLMFYVRSARALPPTALSQDLPCVPIASLPPSALTPPVP